MALPVPTHINHYVHLLPCLPTPNGLLIPSDCMNFHVLRFLLLLRINLSRLIFCFLDQFGLFSFPSFIYSFSAPKSFIFCLYYLIRSAPLDLNWLLVHLFTRPFTRHSVINRSSISPFIHTFDRPISLTHSYLNSSFILDHPGSSNFHLFICVSSFHF